ncbi:MAG: class I SAM-dependent methyltransferase, partial [Bacteroidales bacterium]|nr:class I SAM-dependent methyltransferase [Bacteroidales bacterium]
MQKIRIRGKLKGLFFVTRLDILFLPIANLIIFIGYIAKLGRWISRNRKLSFSDFYTAKFDYLRRYELYKYIVEKENLKKDIDYLEFGVSKGASFKWWVESIKDENSSFYGFDTFTGLPEDWGPFKKGAMSGNNKMPEIDDDRVAFYQGLFQKTLQDFLETHSFK